MIDEEIREAGWDVVSLCYSALRKLWPFIYLMDFEGVSTF